MRNIKDIDPKYWRDDAACKSVDPELFFPSDNARGKARAKQIAAAKSVCLGCRVLNFCQIYNKDEKHGIWGGVDSPAK